MKRGTHISERGMVTMPRRRYPPVELDADGVAWCSQCDRPVYDVRYDRGRRPQGVCSCDARAKRYGGRERDRERGE